MNYGRYEVIELLGSGSMGDVFKAYDPQFDRNIALKVLKKDRVVSDDYVKRFMRGAAAVGRLSHGTIGAAYDIGQEHGTIYIAMELLTGRTLKEQMAKENVGELAVIIKIAKQVAEALHYAHQNGVIHRDIKPENIVCSSKHEIKVTDFGIAHIDDPDGQQMTQEGEVLGTPYYMSPEQFEGRPVDGRSDLYSLGVILYELTTGQRPFQGKSFKSLYLAVTTHGVQEPHTLNPQVPKWLSRLIMTAMAREPGDRFSSGAELIRALDNGEKTNRTDDSHDEPSIALITSIVLLLLGIGVGTAYYLGYIPPIASLVGNKVVPQEEQEITLSPEEKEVGVAESTPTEKIPEERRTPVPDKLEGEVVFDSKEAQESEVEPVRETTQTGEDQTTLADVEPKPFIPPEEQPEATAVVTEEIGLSEKEEPEHQADKLFSQLEEEASIWGIDKDESGEEISLEQQILQDTEPEWKKDSERAGDRSHLENTAAVEEEPEVGVSRGQKKMNDSPVSKDKSVIFQDSSKDEIPVQQKEDKTASLTRDEGLWKTIPTEMDTSKVDTVAPSASEIKPRVLEEEPVPAEPSHSPSELAMKSMVLNSRPEGAKLFVDGEFLGKTPVEIEVSAEKHEIELRLAGHGELKAQVDFSKIKKESHTFRIPSL